MQLDAKTLDDIRSAPKGPKTAALFDFDGTLIAGFSVVQFLREQIRQRKLSLADAGNMLANTAQLVRKRASFSEMFNASCELLAGTDEAEYAEFARGVYESRIARLIYPEARAMIKEHMAMGHTVAIVSSATPYQVEPAAEDLGIDTVYCTQLGIADGRFTGSVDGDVCWGEGKLAAARRLAKDKKFKLENAFFYSDSDEDIPLLETVARPRVLNPNKKLATVAKERDWPVRRFKDVRKVKATGVVRSLAADLSMLPVMLTSLSVMSLTGSKRDAQNFTSAVYPAIASALSGVTLDVTGEENLWAARPAIFVFNHQSKIDPVIVSKLVHKDFVGVGKKEVAMLPFAEKLMEFGGAVLIDRADSGAAVAALKPLVDVIQQEKKSVVMAPEGKRTVSPRLAAFKKGAFHLAIQSGAPIVPVVLHDAIDIAPKGAFVYRPGQVKVEILPPVDTSDWQTDTIDEHVALVRGMFLKALGQVESSDVTAAVKPVGKAKPKAKAKAQAKAKAKTKAKAADAASAETARSAKGKTTGAAKPKASRTVKSVKPKAKAKPKTKAEPNLKAEPKLKAEAKPKAETKSKPESKPKPEAQPKTKPKAARAEPVANAGLDVGTVQSSASE